MTYTYEKNNDYDLIEESDYEVKIERMDLQTTQNGKDKLSIMFRIRDDIEQKNQNRCLFESIWKDKEMPECFNRRRINQLLGTQKDIADKQVFNGINDIIDKMLGAFLIIHVSITYDDYLGKNVNRVSYYKSSNEQPKAISETPVISDDDLPF